MHHCPSQCNCVFLNTTLNDSEITWITCYLLICDAYIDHTLILDYAEFTPHAKVCFLGSSRTPCWLCFVADTFNLFTSLFLSLYCHCWNLASYLLLPQTSFSTGLSCTNHFWVVKRACSFVLTQIFTHVFNSCLAFPTYPPLTHFFPFAKFLTILSKWSFLKAGIQVRKFTFCLHRVLNLCPQPAWRMVSSHLSLYCSPPVTGPQSCNIWT